MTYRTYALGLLAVIILSAAGCNRDIPTRLDKFTFTTAVTTTNAPEASLDSEAIPASTETIYLSAGVMDPLPATKVKVRWTKMPSQVLASQDFTGKGRNNTQAHDFDRGLALSYFASQVTKPGLTWATGEYQVEVFLNGRIVKTLPFHIVNDSESDVRSTQGLLRNLRFGSALTADQDAIAAARTTFKRSDPHIYIQADFAEAALTSTVDIAVRYIKEDLRLVTSSTQLNDDRVMVDLELSRLGRLWPDRLWAEGVYEVTVRINDIEVRTTTFTVTK
jgi:hypothetical protein